MPVRYVCSLDEFIGKRRQYPQIEISWGKGDLSEETIAACWQQFNKTQEKD